MRISQPFARACSRLKWEPGTRIVSPKVVRITFGCCARKMASSKRPRGITQTGHPGP